jgi:hypothetical protein
MIVMRSVAAWRAWTAIARPAKIIGGLFKSLTACRPCRALREHGVVSRNVICCPVMPSPGWSVGVITQNNKTAGFQVHRSIGVVARGRHHRTNIAGE